MALRFPIAVLVVLALAPLAAADPTVDSAVDIAHNVFRQVGDQVFGEAEHEEDGPAQVTPPAEPSPPAEDEGAPPSERAPDGGLLDPFAPVFDDVVPVLDPVREQIPVDFDVDWLLSPRVPDAPAETPVAAPAPAATLQAASVAAPAAAGTAPAALVMVVAAAGGTTGLSLAWDRLRRFGLLAVLYTRIAKERLLDHAGRERLLAQVRLTPGAPLADLARAAETPRNTAVYHLRRLEKEGLVTSSKQGRVRLYFAAGAAQGRGDAEAIAALRHPVSRAIATEIGNTPGVDQRALCERMGLAPSLAHWHATRLEDAGIVTRQREGRHVRYYPGSSHHLARGA